MIEIKIPTGTTIEQACAKVQHVAMMTLENVKTEFNGFVIDSKKRTKDILDEYNAYLSIIEKRE